MDKCVSDAVKAVASTSHLQALKTFEDYHRLTENFRKLFSSLYRRILKNSGLPFKD